MLSDARIGNGENAGHSFHRLRGWGVVLRWYGRATMALAPNLQAIADNAHRLLNDARLLLSHDRFASSVALSILAIEECGKFVILAEGTDPRRRSKLGNHRVRQSALSEPYRTDLWLSFSFSPANQDLFRARMDEVRSMPFDLAANKPIKPTKALEDLREAFEEWIRQMAPKLSEARYILKTGLGDTQETKNAALYVDVDIAKKGSIKSNPARFSKTEAEEWFWQAMRALVEVEIYL